LWLFGVGHELWITHICTQLHGSSLKLFTLNHSYVSVKVDLLRNLSISQDMLCHFDVDIWLNELTALRYVSSPVLNRVKASFDSLSFVNNK
jgi:hypothetical protein